MENERDHATGQKPRNTHSATSINVRHLKNFDLNELVEDHDPEQDGHIGD
jgi:hypothetical protein